jgi:5,10-methylene-tetrahydrofolate dehydrogenase/methenyl tetrahydrofolate cyclohydrolase
VIDVGITYKSTDQNMQGYEVDGDVQFDNEMIQKVGRITPVPGGVGPMTISMLMNNLVNGWVK